MVTPIPKMVAKYGPLYFTANIPKGVYKGVDEDTPVAAATNLLIVNEKLDENLAYQITKLLLEHTADLVAVHKAATEISLKNAVVGSPIPVSSRRAALLQRKRHQGADGEQMISRRCDQRDGLLTSAFNRCISRFASLRQIFWVGNLRLSRSVRKSVFITEDTKSTSCRGAACCDPLRTLRVLRDLLRKYMQGDARIVPQ